MATKKSDSKKPAAAAPQRAGVQMTPVKVSGTVYRSVPAAFAELGLPMSRMTAFRKEVKENGRATFALEDGTKYNFIAQEPGSYVAPQAE